MATTAPVTAHPAADEWTPTPAAPGWTTEDFAAAINVKPSTIRVRLCRTGSYFGVRPRKLANGRLVWPPHAVEILSRG